MCCNICLFEVYCYKPTKTHNNEKQQNDKQLEMPDSLRLVKRQFHKMNARLSKEAKPGKQQTMKTLCKSSPFNQDAQVLMNDYLVSI